MDSSSNNFNSCKYCLKFFKNKYYLENTHINKCKAQHDPVRVLEIQNNFTPDILSILGTSGQCRFCNNNFFNTSNLKRHLITCKQRKNYHQQLFDKTINPFGKESITHFTTEQVIDILRKIHNESKSKSKSKSESESNELNETTKNTKKNTEMIRLITQTWIYRFSQLLRSIPQNKNFKILSRHGSIYNGKDWDRVSISGSIDTVIFNDSMILNNLYDSINQTNELVFKNQLNIEILGHIQDIVNREFTDFNELRKLYRFGVKAELTN